MSDNSYSHHVRALHARRTEPDLRPDPRRDRCRRHHASGRQRHRRSCHRRRRPRPVSSDCDAADHGAPTIDDVAARTSATCSTPRTSRWGWFSGRLPADLDASTARPSAAPRTTTSAASLSRLTTVGAPPSRSSTTQSTANPHHLPPASVAEIGHAGPSQPPVRPDRLLARAGRRQHAGSQLPQGRGLPGRARRLLRPAGRAELPGQHDQRDRVSRYWKSPRSSSPTTTPTAGTTT